MGTASHGLLNAREGMSKKSSRGPTNLTQCEPLSPVVQEMQVCFQMSTLARIKLWVLWWWQRCVTKNAKDMPPFPVLNNLQFFVACVVAWHKKPQYSRMQD